MVIKLNTLLAKTDHLANSYRSSIKDYVQFFKGRQEAFKGERKTYVPRSGVIDLPGERNNKLVTSTVKEKLDWLKETNKEYVDAVFSLEATNAAGKNRTELKVDGTSFGIFSALELLRLKSLLENGELEDMYQNIPVRSDAEEWEPTTDEMYKEREIYEGPKQAGTKKSITKESYILPDPNVSKDSTAYKPTVASKDTVMDLGDYTYQKFSGEWSQRERAELLRRRTKLLSAVIEALKVANDIEAVESEMTADKLFNYLHNIPAAKA